MHDDGHDDTSVVGVVRRNIQDLARTQEGVDDKADLQLVGIFYLFNCKKKTEI